MRPLRRTDGAVLDAVMEGLSERSRYLRFHGPKPRLTSADRARLLAVDGRDHLALVAYDADGAPVGLARAVRLRDDPATAEVAAEVVDARQGEGIGTGLIARLARRAAAAGIERFSATVLSESRFAAGLRRRGWRQVASDGTSVTLASGVWALARAGS